jgi:hypothetical protein
LESVGAMGKYDLAQPSISDRPQPEEMDHDLDAALSASGASANETQDPSARRLDQLGHPMRLHPQPADDAAQSWLCAVIAARRS